MKKIFYLFLFLSQLIFSQDNVKVDLSNPKATLFTHLYFLEEGSYEPVKSAAAIKLDDKSKAVEISLKIKDIYEALGLEIDFLEVPDSNEYLDTITDHAGELSKSAFHRFTPFPLRLPEVYVERSKGKWYYSEKTIKNIDEIYKDAFPMELSWVPKKFPKLFKAKVFGILIWKPILVLFLFLILSLLYRLLLPLLVFVLVKIKNSFAKLEHIKTKALVKELARPLLLLFILWIIEILLPYFYFDILNTYIVTGLKIADTVLWVIVIIALVELILRLYMESNVKSKSRIEKQLAPILSKLFLSFIIFIGFLHILTVFGVRPATVLAGVSIGGLAFAFAAQDTLKNLLGTIVIFLDKPFHIGDWVAIDVFEGQIESVGLRSTRIRAADTTLHQIPNSVISEANINNKGLRTHRRYTTELGIRYDTPPKLVRAFTKGIKEIIKNHPGADNDNYNVEFSSFGDFALLILVNVYFINLEWGDEEAARNILNLAVIELAAELGVEFAFPSTTLMIEQFPEKGSDAPKYKTDDDSIDKSIKTVIGKFTGEDHKERMKNTSTIPDE